MHIFHGNYCIILFIKIICLLDKLFRFVVEKPILTIISLCGLIFILILKARNGKKKKTNNRINLQKEEIETKNK